jgi:hypothetical protein
MPDSQMQAAAERTDALFDRYTLPKVALAVILAASLVGTWVSTTRNGPTGPALALAKWGYLVAMGVLTGGLVWKHAFVRPSDLGDGAADYCAEMYDRFDDIATGAIVILALGGAVVFREYFGVFGATASVVGYGALVVVWLGFAGLSTYRSDTVERQFRSPTGLAALALALAVVVGTAIAEVAINGLVPVTAGVRVLHLLAFALWIGGAVWNIFVAVPTGQKRPTVDVVRAAGQQLERFRWAVRFIIPTLFVTGLHQAVDGFGTSVGWYLGSVVGAAILAKVGFIGLLVVIFKLCPMWRACSPIEGVCDIEDLDRGGSGTTASPASEPVGPSEATNDD